VDLSVTTREPAPDDFYAALPAFRDFSHVVNEAMFKPLPDDWMIGVADVVQSTKAIAERRYKAVNMAGAAVIVAITNALGGRDFPFVFGGDGAGFAVRATDAGRARQALADTATWVRESLDLSLRIGMISAAEIRAHGHDIRVARFAASDHVTIAMFSGGGMAYADAAMKRGEITVMPAPAGAQPDLTGLSCRYELIPAQRGQVLSLVVSPGPQATPDTFRAAIKMIADIVAASPDASRPIPGKGLRFKWPPQGIDFEVLASRRRGQSMLRTRIRVLAKTFLSFLILRFRLRFIRFDPDKYEREIVENSDFRKFDDTLRMVLDCTPELAVAIEDYLKAAAADGIVRFGTHKQEAAMMTCFTPNPAKANHVHFIDGADGGYATAATMMKTSVGT
jgi:hypothetical protein